MVKSSLLTFRVLLIAALPMHVWAYNILLVPMIGKSHVFSAVSIAEGLVTRGNMVTLFIGEHFPLHLAKMSNQTELSVVRYRDTTDGVPMDYSAIDEYHSTSAIESRGNVKNQVATIMTEMCVNFTYVK